MIEEERDNLDEHVVEEREDTFSLEANSLRPILQSFFARLSLDARLLSLPSLSPLESKDARGEAPGCLTDDVFATAAACRQPLTCATQSMAMAV